MVILQANDVESNPGPFLDRSIQYLKDYLNNEDYNCDTIKNNVEKLLEFHNNNYPIEEKYLTDENILLWNNVKQKAHKDSSFDEQFCRNIHSIWKFWEDQSIRIEYPDLQFPLKTNNTTKNSGSQDFSIPLSDDLGKRYNYQRNQHKEYICLFNDYCNREKKPRKNRETLINHARQDHSIELDLNKKTGKRGDPVTCLCGKTFIRPQTLKSHQEIPCQFYEDNYDDGSGLQSCDKCDKIFKAHCTLKNHQRKQHDDGAGLQPCDICNKNFKTQRILETHKRKLHKILPPPKLHVGKRPRGGPKKTAAMEPTIVEPLQSLSSSSISHSFSTIYSQHSPMAPLDSKVLYHQIPQVISQSPLPSHSSTTVSSLTSQPSPMAQPLINQTSQILSQTGILPLHSQPMMLSNSDSSSSYQLPFAPHPCTTALVPPQPTFTTSTIPPGEEVKTVDVSIIDENTGQHLRTVSVPISRQMKASNTSNIDHQQLIMQPSSIPSNPIQEVGKISAPILPVVPETLEGEDQDDWAELWEQIELPNPNVSCPLDLIQDDRSLQTPQGLPSFNLLDSSFSSEEMQR